MASITKSQTTQGGTIEQGQQQGVGSPISNEAYDVLTALHSKLEGLEAYRKFSKDGNQQLWQELSDADVKCVDRLITELETLVKGNKFRMQTPGAAGKA